MSKLKVFSKKLNKTFVVSLPEGPNGPEATSLTAGEVAELLGGERGDVAISEWVNWSDWVNWDKWTNWDKWNDWARGGDRRG